MEAQDGVLKTGTSTVGITFNGGVVVGADHQSDDGSLYRKQKCPETVQDW